MVSTALNPEIWRSPPAAGLKLRSPLICFKRGKGPILAPEAPLILLKVIPSPMYSSLGREISQVLPPQL